MSDAYLGEIRCFGFTFAPVNWAACNGQLLPIQQYAALFSLLGTYFGGNGTTNFALPNLQGQVPMHWGSTSGLTATNLGETQGTTAIALTIQQIPQHTHPIIAAAAGAGAERSAIPTNQTYLSDSKGAFVYASATPNTAFSPKAIGISGGTQSHENMQPYLAVNFCICLNGTFPPRG